MGCWPIPECFYPTKEDTDVPGQSLQDFFRILLVLGVILILGVSCASGADNPGDMFTVRPETISIGSFFSGQLLTVAAAVPNGSEVALRLVGPPENLVVMKKSRVAGLWMNGEEISFRNLPTTYLLWTSQRTALPGDGDDAAAQLYRSELAGCLQDRTRDETSFLLGELVKLKEADNLYQISQGDIRIRRMPEGSWDQVEAFLPVPAKIHPGDYRLDLITLKEGKKNLLHSTTIGVKLVGFPAVVADMATRSGLLYGVISVFIAMISGLLVGFVFRSKRGH
jgi:hypothetical protein